MRLPVSGRRVLRAREKRWATHPTAVLRRPRAAVRLVSRRGGCDVGALDQGAPFDRQLFDDVEEFLEVRSADMCFEGGRVVVDLVEVEAVRVVDVLDDFEASRAG